MPQSLPPGVPRVGDVFAGKYRVDRLLGLGGMGVVVAATHLHLDEVVAIKLLLPDVAKDAELVARFLREGRAAVKIHSEHVARVLDVATDDSGAPYMVMEYLDGGDLAQVLAHHGPLPVTVTVDYVLQACEALAEAHALGIIHRDLKPGNLFLSTRSDGSHVVKVLDFGISKLLAASAEPQAPWSITKTRTSMGSPAYMSPEQMRSARKVDQRADIWALGTTMYELLTGRAPFDGETMPELCAAILQDTPASIRALRTDVPLGLEAIIRRCLEKDAAARYGSIVELAAALAAFGTPAGRGSAERILRIAHTIGQRSVSRSSVSSGEFTAAAAVPAPRVNTASAWGETKRARSHTAKRLAIAGGALLVVSCAGLVALVIARGPSDARTDARGAPTPSFATSSAPSVPASSAPSPRVATAAAPSSAPPAPSELPSVTSSASSNPTSAPHAPTPHVAPLPKPKPSGTANDRQG
jgi:serine/threonine protein kinase